jgi:hypothetical protein
MAAFVIGPVPSNCTSSYGYAAGYGYGYDTASCTTPTNVGGGSSSSNLGTTTNTTTPTSTTNTTTPTSTTDGTMVEFTYGVKASALNKTTPGYFATRNAALTKMFKSKGIKTRTQIRKELNKSADFTAKTTSLSDRSRLVNTLYNMIRAAK